MARTMKEYIAKVETKMEALILVGNLLAGNIQVDIDTDKMTEATQDEQLFDAEFSNMLKAIGVKNVPVEILNRCGKRTVETTDEDGEITIDDVTELIDSETATGLLNDLITGATQVDATTGKIYWCYGGYDNAEHCYATVKECVGMNISVKDVCDIYAENWQDDDMQDMDAVEKIVNLIRG